MSETATQEAVDRAATIRKELDEIESAKEELDEGSSLHEMLQKQEAKLVRELGNLNKQERQDLEAKITSGHNGNGLKYKVVLQTEYEKAQQGKVSDERAAALMSAAEGAGVLLEPGEIVVIKKGGGVDPSVSESLTKQFKSELATLGQGFVVMASRGSVSTGSGTRGDLSGFTVGTRLSKTYQDTEYEIEVIERDGVRILSGVTGTEIKGKEFKTLSGAAQAITGYNTRGTKWWGVVAEASKPKPSNSTNGK